MNHTDDTDLWSIVAIPKLVVVLKRDFVAAGGMQVAGETRKWFVAGAFDCGDISVVVVGADCESDWCKRVVVDVVAGDFVVVDDVENCSVVVGAFHGASRALIAGDVGSHRRDLRLALVVVAVAVVGFDLDAA